MFLHLIFWYFAFDILHLIKGDKKSRISPEHVGYGLLHVPSSLHVIDDCPVIVQPGLVHSKFKECLGLNGGETPGNP